MNKKTIIKMIKDYENGLYRLTDIGTSEDKKRALGKWNAVYMLCQKIGISARDLSKHQQAYDDQFKTGVEMRTYDEEGTEDDADFTFNFGEYDNEVDFYGN